MNIKKKLESYFMILLTIFFAFSMPVFALAASSNRTAAKKTVQKFLNAARGSSYTDLNKYCSTEFFGSSYDSSVYFDEYRLSANSGIQYSFKSMKITGDTAKVKVSVKYKSAYRAFYHEFAKILYSGKKYTTKNTYKSIKEYLDIYPPRTLIKNYNIMLLKEGGKWKINTYDDTTILAIGNILYMDMARAAASAYRDRF